MGDIKILYIIVSDSGDGSSSLNFTFDADLVTHLNENIDDFENFMSGDGLQVTKLKVPADSTFESLGISFPMDREDYL